MLIWPFSVQVLKNLNKKTIGKVNNFGILLLVKAKTTSVQDDLGKGPKIKKRESMVFDRTSLTPTNPKYVLFTQNF